MHKSPTATTLTAAQFEQVKDGSARKTLTQSRIRPPQFLLLSYQQIEVFLVPFLTDDDDIDLLGQYRADIHSIFIRAGLSRQEEAHTLLHEVLHAVYHLYAGSQKDQEERLVSLLSNGLAETMRRNPDLLGYLSKSWE